MEGKSSSEGKSREGKDADDDDPNLPPDVAAFYVFSMSDDLSAVSRGFVRAHCHKFACASARATSGEGYPLEWSQLHREYCALVDGALQDFCDRRGVTPGALFAMLQDSMADSAHMADYIPQFLKLFQGFDAFVAQMTSEAALAALQGTAAAAAAEEAGDGRSGTWSVMHDYSKAEHDAFLSSLKVPWIIRKMLTTLLNNKRFTAVCTYDGKTLTRTFSLGMAGTKTEYCVLDGTWMRHPNRPRKQNIRGRGQRSDDGLKCCMQLQRCKDDALTQPTSGRCLSNVYTLSEDGQVMNCTEFLALLSDPGTPTGPIFSYNALKTTDD